MHLPANDICSQSPRSWSNDRSRDSIQAAVSVEHDRSEPSNSHPVIVPAFNSIAFETPSHCLPFSLHLSNSLKLPRLHPPVFKKSTLSSSSALARLFTSTHKHTLKNCFSSRLSLFGFLSRGVPFVAIRNRAFKGSSLRYGGSDSIISMAIMPRDHMSTLGPYSFCLTTSGAIQ